MVSEVEDIGKQYEAAAQVDLDTYFTSRIRLRVPSWRDVLLNSKLLKFFLAWCRSHRLTVAPIEFCNGRDKRRADSSMSFDTFAALCVIEETNQLQQQHADVDADDEVDCSAIAAAEGVVEERREKRPKRIRRKTAYDIFRLLYGDEQKTLGLTYNPCASDDINDMKAAFTALPAEKLEALEDEAKYMPDIPWRDYAAMRRGGMLALGDIPRPDMPALEDISRLEPPVCDTLAIARARPPISLTGWLVSSTSDMQVVDFQAPPTALFQRPSWAPSMVLTTEKFVAELPVVVGPAGCRRPSVLGAFRQWKTATSHIASSSIALPKADNYAGVGRSCPALQTNHHPNSVAQLRQRLVGLLDEACKHEVYLIACVVELAEDGPGLLPLNYMTIAHLASGNKAVGTVPARMNFMMLEFLTGDGAHVVGSVLRYLRLPPVESKDLKYTEFTKATVVSGPIHHLSLDGFCRACIYSAPANSQFHCVKLLRLHATLKDGDQFVITDMNDAELVVVPPAAEDDGASSGDDWAETLLRVSGSASTGNSGEELDDLLLRELEILAGEIPAAVAGGGVDDLPSEVSDEGSEVPSGFDSGFGEPMEDDDDPPTPVPELAEEHALPHIELSEEELRRVRLSALEEMKDINDVEVLYSRLCMESHIISFLRCARSARPMGRFQVVLGGRTVKAVCKVHKKCEIFLPVRGAHDLCNGECSALRWLAASLDTSVAEHFALRDQLKASWRARV